jgi:hypothetical protein
LEIKLRKTHQIDAPGAGSIAVPVRRDLLMLRMPESPSDRSVEKRRLRKYFVLNVIREQGPLSRASDLFWDQMMHTVSRHALPAALARTKVVVEQPSTNLSLVGAVAVVLHHIFYSSHVSYEEVI